MRPPEDRTLQDALASEVGAGLCRRGWTVVTAESCTAGLLAAAITSVPGSSAWFRGGLVVYANDLKVLLAGVQESTLLQHGAVSRQVAEELARGARARCRADCALSVTGVAGPGGGTEQKPVGLVHVGVAVHDVLATEELHLAGDRAAIRMASVTAALALLRRTLETLP